VYAWGSVRRGYGIHRPDAAPAIFSEADMVDGGDVLPGFRYPLSRLFGFEV
jgi:hypothetical protein